MRSGVLALFSLVALVASATGCSSSGEEPEPASTVASRPEAVIIDFYGDKKASARCTGTLLAPNVVLTAAHCVDGSRGARVINPSTRKSTTVVDIKTYDWMPHASASENRTSHDLALLVLRDPIKIKQYATIQSSECVDCRVVHVGRFDSKGAPSSALRQGTPTIASKQPIAEHPFEQYLARGSADAGGGVFRATSRNPLLVGLMVSKSGKGKGSYMARLDDPRIQRWIGLTTKSINSAVPSSASTKPQLHPLDDPPPEEPPPEEPPPEPPPEEPPPEEPPPEEPPPEEPPVEEPPTDVPGETPEDAPVDPTDQTEPDPSADPTADPTTDPGADPTEDPTNPTEDPTSPTEDPTSPTEDPTSPTEDPTNPGENPAENPSQDPPQPTEDPTGTEPSSEPATPPVEDTTVPGGAATSPEESEQKGEPKDEQPLSKEEEYDPSRANVLNPDKSNLKEVNSTNYYGTAGRDPKTGKVIPSEQGLVNTESANAKRAGDSAFIVGTHGLPGSIETEPNSKGVAAIQKAAGEGKTVVMSVCYAGSTQDPNDDSGQLSSSVAKDMSDKWGVPPEKIAACTGEVTPVSNGFACNGTWVDGNGNATSPQVKGNGFWNCSSATYTPPSKTKQGGWSPSNCTSP